MKVYVKSKSEKWLMPTHPAKARVLLKNGKAKVIQRTPFSIQLNYETTEYTQPVTVGIDDGGVSVGVAAVSGGKTLCQQELTLRKDIKKLMDTRRSYRRGRRHRNKRYRKPRFLNRRQSIPVCKVCGGNAPKSKVICRKCLRAVDGVHQKYADILKTDWRLPPSIKAKKDAIIRDIQKLPLPVDKIRLEDAFFDFQAMDNPDISGKNYQFGPRFYHRNIKQACLVRDGFKCRKCSAEENLKTHHITPKSQGGTDRLPNLMTLCEDCHQKHHWQGMKLPRQKTSFYMSAAHVQQGKNYLKHKLEEIASVERTFGYITSYYRGKAGLEKTHVNDAVIIADNYTGIPEPEYLKTLHVRPRKRSLHEANPRKGRKKPNREAKRNCKNVYTVKGISRCDVVKIFGRTGFITGLSSNGQTCTAKDIDGNYLKRPGKTYSTLPLSQARKIHSNQSFISDVKNALGAKGGISHGLSEIKRLTERRETSS